MNSNVNMNEEMVKVKIETNEGLFYTLKTIPRKAIYDYKKLVEERDNCSYTYNSVINLLVKSELDGLMGDGLHAKSTGYDVCNDLVYLKEENKIINKNQIKQSLIQILEPITSL